MMVAGTAGLDVFRKEPLAADSPFWTMENVIVTPHAGGRSVREAERMAHLVEANLRNMREGRPLLNVISLG